MNKEIKTEVKTFRIELQCDECDGIMSHNGIVLTSNPPLFPHECDKCGYRKNVRGIKYPYLKTEQ